MPLHLIVTMEGTILHAGPTLHKLRPEIELVGAPFQAHFDVRRPREADSVADLARLTESPLRLHLRDRDRTALKGQAVPLSCGRAMLIDLSFGISVVEAVRRFRLTSADFGATDLTVEMLFLVEAQRAALEESKKLNGRLQSARLAAEQEAATDKLTGAKNRRAMDHMLIRLLGQGTPFGLIHVDLDDFKAINDTHGHPAGDAVLREVARVLKDATRARDMVARIGGDEFVVVLHGMTHTARLSDLAERILARFDRPIRHDGAEIPVSVSLGIAASALYDRPEAETLLADADRALYASKRDGRGRYSIAPGKPG
ncbi:diguanylate cyclase [Rhodovulum sp. 12E13]|nr:diguanylate cyclase [Rhodovulum sp. 12E13]